MSFILDPSFRGGDMKDYQDPTIVTLGTVAELTESANKCAGSADLHGEQVPFTTHLGCPPV
jgi:hypothetical protein